MFESMKGLFGRQARTQTTVVKPVQGPRPRALNPFHAVSINPGPRCCQAAKALTGVRFLSAQAPRLPLPQCEAGTCECKYLHHEDRRADDRRAVDGGPSRGGPPFAGPDRRKSKRDRRESA
jgi:hypothetical protein